MTRRRIQLYEYVTAQGARGEKPLALSLLSEGRAMLDALADDFRGVNGVEVEILDEIPAKIDADWTMVIAPETDGVLERVARQVVEAGGRLLGPSPEAIWSAADKLVLSRHFEARGVATPGTERFDETSETLVLRKPFVLKPRDGAGSQDTFLIRSREEWDAIVPTLTGEMILQPFIEGHAASVAFLIGPHHHLSLLPCSQVLSSDGRFHYLGGSLPLGEDSAIRATALAERAVRSIDGLMGYVGVDLILGLDDVVIEINPRLTTSYLGLRQACCGNLAEAMLKIAEGVLCELTWDRTPRRFGIDG